MIIQSEHKALYAISFLFLCGVMASLIIYLDSGQLAIPLIMLVLSSFVCLRQWIAVGRKIKIDRNGIDISFLGYKKSYKWKELNTRAIVDYEGSIGYRDEHIRGVEFSPRAPRRLRQLKPAEYCVLVAPFSFVFIYFNVNESSPTTKMYPNLYSIDERIFMEKLRSWGIEKTEEGFLNKTRDGSLS